MTAYFRALPASKTVLWCYLIWYLSIVTLYFDPNPRLWVNSLGISLIIGFALILSVKPNTGGAMPDRWQTFRLFMMPFCVSSFSSLIKGKHFLLVFPPKVEELAIPLSLCALFLCALFLLKRQATKA